MRADSNTCISVVMVDGSFREYFHALDFFGQQTLSPEEYELTWVEYYDQIQPELAEKIAQHPNFKIVTLNRTGTYHSSYCFNHGIREARGEIVVIPDADVVVEKDFLETLWREHQSNDQLVIYNHRFNEPKEQHQPTVDIQHLREHCVLTNPANHGGCLSVRKKWLSEINGYEQHPIFQSGFHANDMDLFVRLKNLGLHVMWHPTARLYHPWHPFTAFRSGEARINFESQWVIIQYRAENLLTTSYSGLDPSRDSEPSPALLTRIEDRRQQLIHEERRAVWKDRIRQFFQRTDPVAWRRDNTLG